MRVESGILEGPDDEAIEVHRRAGHRDLARAGGGHDYGRRLPLARYSLPVRSAVGTVQGADALRRVGAGDWVELRIVRADGGHEKAVALSPAAASLAGDLLSRACDAGAGAVALLAEDPETSPEEFAADTDELARVHGL